MVELSGSISFVRIQSINKRNIHFDTRYYFVGDALVAKIYSLRTIALRINSLVLKR